ncbi:MAG TPA: hypothetical protein VFD32_06375 [Dehalococcoidia bacterium]|nr:hypothetical protein [Dehalococcoidia bacterium]
MSLVVRMAALCGAAILAVGVACGGSGKSDTAKITDRVNSLVSHYNKGDAKAILDDDVPASARRTCSDSDAKDFLTQEKQLASHYTVRSVDNVSINGKSARAMVSLLTDGAKTAQVPFPLVKSGGNWLLDTSGMNGCNGLFPSAAG